MKNDVKFLPQPLIGCYVQAVKATVRKNLLSRSAAVAMLVWTLLSCQHTETTPTVLLKSFEKPVVENGILMFADESDFDSLLKQLRTNFSVDKLNQMESSLAGYTSMRTAYKAIDQQDIQKIGQSGSLEGYTNLAFILKTGEEQELNRMIAEECLATVFNKDGLVIIGDNVYKYMFDKILVVKKYKQIDLVKLVEFEPTGLSSVAIIPVARKRNGNTLTAIPNGRAAAPANQYCVNNYDYHGTKRMAADINLSTTGGGHRFSSISGGAKHQQRQFGIWFSQSTASVKATYFVALQYYNSGARVPGQIPVSCENCSSTPDVPICDDCYGSLTITGNVLCSDGNQRQCEVTEAAF